MLVGTSVARNRYGNGIGVSCCKDDDTVTRPECLKAVPWSMAEAHCKAHDASLCTVAQLWGRGRPKKNPCGFDALSTWTSEKCGGDYEFLEPARAVEKKKNKPMTPILREPGYRWLIVGKPGIPEPGDKKTYWEIDDSGRKHKECANVYQTRSTASNKRGSRIVTTCCATDSNAPPTNLRSFRARDVKGWKKNVKKGIKKGGCKPVNTFCRALAVVARC